MKRTHQQSGFSLIEVMVAILVLGIALVGLTEGITTALDSSKESELQTTAALFAAGQIELLRAEGDFTDGELEGDCGEGLPLYRWKQTISSTDIQGLHEVLVTVMNSRTGKEIYELRTLLFQLPEDSGTSTSGKRNESTSRDRSGSRRSSYAGPPQVRLVQNIQHPRPNTQRPTAHSQNSRKNWTLDVSPLNTPRIPV